MLRITLIALVSLLLLGCNTLTQKYEKPETDQLNLIKCSWPSELRTGEKEELVNSLLEFNDALLVCEAKRAALAKYFLGQGEK